MNISKKTILISLIVLVGIIGVTIGALILIRGLGSNDSTKTPASEASVTARKILAEFTSQVSTGTILSDAELVTSDGKTTEPLYVYDTTSKRFVSLPTANIALLRTEQSTVEAATDTIETFLAKQGLAKTNKISTASVLTNFASDTITCELSMLAVDETSPVELHFACIDDYASKLSDVRQLIDLWPAHTTASYDVISSNSLVKDGTTVTIMKASTEDFTTTHTLVYVQTNNEWKYIGDASEGTAVEDNERYVINADIKAGLDNADYGDVLAEAFLKL